MKLECQTRHLSEQEKNAHGEQLGNQQLPENLDIWQHTSVRSPKVLRNLLHRQRSIVERNSLPEANVVRSYITRTLICFLGLKLHLHLHSSIVLELVC